MKKCFLIIFFLLAIIACEKEEVQECRKEIEMSNSNGIITAPVSVWDVQQVLGTTENMVEYLCIHKNINKWARFKPVIYGDTFASVPGEIENWWQATNGNSGFSISTFNSMIALISAANNSTGWEYKHPTGGEDAPYRLADFNGYAHEARDFVRIQVVNYDMFGQYGQAIVNLERGGTSHIGGSDYAGIGELTFKDINIFSSQNWYLGLCIFNPDNNSQFIWATSAGDIESGTDSSKNVTIFHNIVESSGYDITGWKSFLFFSSVRMPNGSTSNPGAAVVCFDKTEIFDAMTVVENRFEFAYLPSGQDTYILETTKEAGFFWIQLYSTVNGETVVPTYTMVGQELRNITVAKDEYGMVLVTPYTYENTSGGTRTTFITLTQPGTGKTLQIHIIQSIQSA